MRGVAIACFLVGCYSPSPQAGIQCSPEGRCPSPFVCSSATNTCEASGSSSVDAPMSDTLVVDAAPDGAQAGCVGSFQQFCVSPPSAPVSFSASTTIDTATSMMCVA